MLRGPMEWFSRRKTGPEEVASTLLPVFEVQDDSVHVVPLLEAATETPEAQPPTENTSPETVPGRAPSPNSHLLPTQVLLQKSIDLPPYLNADYQEQVQPEGQPPQEEELTFDGWEDEPPAMVGRAGRFGQPAPPPPWSNGTAALERQPRPDPDSVADPSAVPLLFPVPTLFENEPEDEAVPLSFPLPRLSSSQITNEAAPSPTIDTTPATPKKVLQGQSVAVRAEQFVLWARKVAASMLPSASRRQTRSGVDCSGKSACREDLP